MSEPTPKTLVLSPKEIDHIAELARLRLRPDEKALFRQQLSAILEYAAQLQAVDTAGIAPTSSVLPERAVLREDEPRPSLAPQTLLRNAPHTEDDQLRVPPIFE